MLTFLFTLHGEGLLIIQKSCHEQAIIPAENSLELFIQTEYALKFYDENEI